MSVFFVGEDFDKFSPPLKCSEAGRERFVVARGIGTSLKARIYISSW